MRAAVAVVVLSMATIALSKLVLREEGRQLELQDGDCHGNDYESWLLCQEQKKAQEQQVPPNGASDSAVPAKLNTAPAPSKQRMELMPGKRECDWRGVDAPNSHDGVDINGHHQGGRGTKLADCLSTCMQRSNCNFAAHSSRGYCHHFQTCKKRPQHGNSRWSLFRKDENPTWHTYERLRAYIVDDAVIEKDKARMEASWDCNGTPLNQCRKKVLLVTAGIPGFTAVASGIASMMLNYALLLRNTGHDVSILLTQYKDASEVADAYNVLWGIKLYTYDHHPPQLYGTFEMKQSYTILQFLLAHDEFDVVVFHDYRGHALYPLHAKRSGMAFQDTTLVVTCHTSSRLADYYKAVTPGVKDLVVYGMEDQTRFLADVTVFPGKFMKGYVLEHAVVDSSTMNAIINANFIMHEPPPPEQEHVQSNKIAFFGRFDRLKGFYVFLDALTKMIEKDPSRRLKVLFVGTPVKADLRNSESKTTEDVITQMASTVWSSSLEVEVITNLNSKQAMTKFREEGWIVVLPSLGDNYPCTVLEAVSWGIPMIHTNAGSMPEIVQRQENMVPSGSVAALANALEAALDNGIKLDSLSPEALREKSTSGFLQVIESNPKNPSFAMTANVECADVTVGIVTHNRIEYLQQAVQSLKTQQACSGFHVIIYNTGECSVPDSSACQSDELRLIQDELTSSGIITQVVTAKVPNEYISSARNALVALVETKYLLFFDDDDIAASNMIQSMVQSAAMTNADVVTGFCGNFLGMWDFDAPSSVKHISLAAGNLGSAGFKINYVAKANFLGRVSKIREVGGAIPEIPMKNAPYVDWGLLQRLMTNNAKIAVVPSIMYYYREKSRGSIFYNADHTAQFYGRFRNSQDLCRDLNLSVVNCDMLLYMKLGSSG